MASELTPEQRSLRARVGAHAMHAQHDSQKTSLPGRLAAKARFYRQVDEAAEAAGEKLTPAERDRRARHAESQHMTHLAFLSSKARGSR